MNTAYKWYLGLLLAPLLLAGMQGCSSDGDDPLLSVDDSGHSPVNLSVMRSELDSLPLGDLTDTEQDGILYMYEEEKLARDVYLYLDQVWNHRVFKNISDSEQTHIDSMLLLIERYRLSDPVGNNPPGVFANSILQQLHDDLIAQGTPSLIDALKVGALIEEVDLVDIKRYIADVSGNDDIVLVYENLMKGSRNHLRAFVRNLETLGIAYAPEYLDSAEYEAIINSPMER